LQSIGIDGWGVDFGLLDKAGALLGMPRSYRDNAFHEKNMKEAITFLGGEPWLYHQTYLANEAFNPLFQLYSMKKRNEGALESAGTLLMIPNLVEYFLTGVKHSEYTVVATSQLYDMKHKCWAGPLLEKLEIPLDLFTPVHLAGESLGCLTPQVAQETGRNVMVISVACHDTASAVSAISSDDSEFMYLSSGTWSLMGVCSEKLCEDEQAPGYGLSNEGSSDGGYRSNVNIVGLWILQECQKQWSSEGRVYTHEELIDMAEQAESLRSFIRPEDYEKIGNYPQMIRKYCTKTRQPVPEEPGQIIRCILESLVLKYRQIYEIFKLNANACTSIHVVGGGVKNRLLNQFTANALNIPVVTGPAEAAAVGNVLVQLETLGELSGREEKNEVITRSFTSEVFTPRDQDRWEEAYEYFRGLYV
jgi:sugar (pentulose or hexulose) kinase